MTAVLWQITGLALLLALLAAGEAWLQRRTPLTGPQRAARGLIVLTAVGGAVGAPAWWVNNPAAFSWALPPLAARYLAVAAVSFALIGLRALLRPDPGQTRQVLAMLAVYLGPLTIAIVTLHRDRFDPAAPITAAFFAIVGLLLAGSLWLLRRLPRGPARRPDIAATVIGVTAGVWGLALFAWPAAPVPLLWPWAQDPLTSRLIASMFLTVATACLTAGGGPARRSVQWLCISYGTGISAATALALMAGKPAPLTYLVIWAAIAAVAAARLIADGFGRAPAPARPD